MRIERKYHTEYLRQMEEIDGELRQIQETMTEDEAQRENEESRRGFERLMARIEREEAKNPPL